MCVIECLQAYVAAQHILIKTLKNTYVCHAPLFEDVPKRGLLSVNDELWEFQKHGSGVSFTEVATKKSIDAHTEMISYPEGFDAWRLVQYFESIHVNFVDYKSNLFNVTQERNLANLLECLCQDGLLIPLKSNSKIFRLT